MSLGHVVSRDPAPVGPCIPFGSFRVIHSYHGSSFKSYVLSKEAAQFDDGSLLAWGGYVREFGGRVNRYPSHVEVIAYTD